MNYKIKIREFLLLIRSGKRLWISSGYILICLTVFLMPFPRSWSLYAMGLSMVAGLLTWISDYDSLSKAFLKKFSLNLAPVVYFVIILLYFIIQSPGWQFLEGYLMFLLVPVFCFPVFSSDYFNERRNLFIKSFISGLLTICLFEFIRALYLNSLHLNYHPDTTFDYYSNTSPFRSQLLSFLEHPTYLSIKVLFAVCLMILTRKELRFSLISSGLVVLILLIFIYFLSSRTIYLASIIICLSMVYFYLKRFRLHLLIVIIIPLILFGSFKLFSLNQRFSAKLDSFMKSFSSENRNLKNIDSRAISWVAAFDLIKQHPIMGVGLQSRDILADEYLKSGNSYYSKLRLNAHNQFLETQLALGIPGTLALLWMLFAPLFRKRELWKPGLYYSFLVILCTAFLFESVLVRQWGIMFYTIFYCFQVNTKPDTSVTL